MSYAISNNGQTCVWHDPFENYQLKSGESFSDVLPAQTLAQAQAAQIAVIDTAYAAAVQVSVSFKAAAGVTKTYQADNQGPLSSQSVLLKTYTGYNIDGATPAGFYWQAEDNTQVPFTLADLSGLYKTMLAQGNAAFSQRAALKAAIRAATTVAAVQAIVWP